MRMQHPAVVQVDELMLTAAAHARDSRADNGASLRGRDPTPQRGMMHLKRGDATPDDERAERDDRALDFR